MVDRQRAEATALGTSGLVTVASSTKHTSYPDSFNQDWAVASAKLVLPMPPGPTTVTIRSRVSSDASFASASLRPTSRVLGRIEFVWALNSGPRSALGSS